MLFNVFDGIVYINLDHRTDRNEAFLKEMERLGVDTQRLLRISACNDPLNGVRACLYSHIEALKIIKKKGWKQGLILEDDCFFSESIDTNTIEGFFDSVKNGWDVFFLGGKYLKKEKAGYESIIRIKKSIRAHAYSINQHYVSTLLKCFEETTEKVKDDLFFIYSQPNALDYAWHELQNKDRWFALEETAAFQTESYSDIDCCHKYKRYR